MKRRGAAWILCGAGTAAFMAACRWAPGFAALWRENASGPALAALHRLTAAAPFPVIEPAACALAALVLIYAARAVRARRPRLLRRAAAVLLMPACAYALLWYPAYWAAPAEAHPTPDAARLEALCGALTDELNGAALRFPPAGRIVAQAAEAAGMDGARVKAARYPEWMRALRLAGVFAPWTGEAVVDAGAPACFAAFTAVHELMHLRGIADEGAANIAAWQACAARGGEFADSARLWALRYALNALYRADPRAYARVGRRMDGRLAALFAGLTPSAAAQPGRLAEGLGIASMTDSYDALLGWLVAHPEAVS